MKYSTHLSEHNDQFWKIWKVECNENKRKQKEEKNGIVFQLCIYGYFMKTGEKNWDYEGGIGNMDFKKIGIA